MARRYWYFYVSGDEGDPSNYTRIFGDPVNSCLGGQIICAVYGLPNVVDPNFPQAFELANAFSSYAVAAKLILSCYPLPPQKPYLYTRYS